jgi:hypothetical protein
MTCVRLLVGKEGFSRLDAPQEGEEIPLKLLHADGTHPIIVAQRSGSGKEARSPEPPPLRTVRASFDAYGSSLYERPSRDADFATTNPSLWTCR